MTPEFLNSTLEHLYERTKEGKQHWNVEMKTSEYKEESEKPVVEADGKQWVVDECYTAYSCEEHGNEFVMITYENIETCGEEVRSTNMVFLPDPNVRYFDLDRLAQYAILPSQKLMETIHQLFTLLLFSSEGRKCPGRVENQRIGNDIADSLQLHMFPVVVLTI